MPTENVVIKFTADTSGLKDSVAELQKIGKLSDEDAKKFQQMEGFAEGVADALKEAGIDAKTFNKEITSAANSGKSLKTQFMEAKNEAVKLSREFGATSTQARNAAKSAALLKDEIDDMNAVLKALNPEAKLNAFVNLGQGVQGAFQAATGALQVFGVENERITKLAQQFQGVLNLTQGINSVLQLKDVYTQLRLVLGVTTAAQTGLTVATEAGAVATVGLNAGLVATATAVAPLVIAVGALIAISYALTQSMFDEAEAIHQSNEELKEKRRLADEAAKSYLDFIGINEKYYELLKLQGKTELEIQQLRLKNVDTDIELLRLGRERANDSKVKIEFDEKINNLLLDRQILELGINKLLEEQAVLNDQAKNKFTKASILPSPQQATEDLENLFDVIGTTITTLSTDLPQLPFFSEEELQQKREDLANFFDQIVEAYSQVNDSILALNNQLYQNDLNNLKESRDAGYLTEKQYNEKVKTLREKQFEINKKAQIAQAIIGTAQGIINALATTPPEAVPAAIALATAVGAINLARIISVEPPKFKKGTLNVGGGNLDSDGGMHAIIHKGEAIIPADRNREYHPTIKALYNRQVKASDINSFVQMKMNGKLPTSINAKFDTNKLGKMMRGSGVVELSNAKVVGKIIASELNKGVDIRRW